MPVDREGVPRGEDILGLAKAALRGVNVPVELAGVRLAGDILVELLGLEALIMLNAGLGILDTSAEGGVETAMVDGVPIVVLLELLVAAPSVLAITAALLFCDLCNICIFLSESSMASSFSIIRVSFSLNLARNFISSFSNCSYNSTLTQLSSPVTCKASSNSFCGVEILCISFLLRGWVSLSDVVITSNRASSCRTRFSCVCR